MIHLYSSSFANDFNQCKTLFFNLCLNNVAMRASYYLRNNKLLGNDVHLASQTLTKSLDTRHRPQLPYNVKLDWVFSIKFVSSF